MARADLLALDALIVACHEATAAALANPDDSSVGAQLAALRVDLATGPLAAAPNTLLARARRYTRTGAAVPEIDDALAYLYEVYVPRLRPDPALTSLTDIVAWHDRNTNLDTRVESALWMNAEGVLRRERHTLLAALAAEHTKQIAKFLDNEPRRFLGVRPDARSAELIDAARLHVARTLAHGLVYGIEPDALMSHTGPDRIGNLGHDARAALATYRAARLQAGHPALGRRTQRLADAALQAEPQLFER